MPERRRYTFAYWGRQQPDRLGRYWHVHLAEGRWWACWTDGSDWVWHADASNKIYDTREQALECVARERAA